MNRLPEIMKESQIQLSLTSILASAKEGLLAVAVQTGMQVLQAMLQEEVKHIAGEKGKHIPDRQAVRHGTENGSVILGGRRVKIQKPRIRSLSGQEIRLESYETFQDPKDMTQGMLEKMVHGLSTRNYSSGLESVGHTVDGKSISKSTVSRKFIQETAEALNTLLSRDLHGERQIFPTYR